MSDQQRNLKHIKVKGFKSIAELDLPMTQLNILIGANGAGKTNFISLFTFLNHLSQRKLKTYVAIEGGAERFFHFGTRTTDEIALELALDSKHYHVVFRANVDDDSLVFAQEYYTVDSSNDIQLLQPKRGESGFTSSYLQQCRVYHFHDTSSQAKFKKTNKLVNHAFLEKDAANLAPFLYHLKNSSQQSHQQAYKQIVAAIRVVAPFFHDFYLEPTGKKDDENIRLRWTHKKHDTPFSANVWSDGTARFVCLATLFLQPETCRPDTIILDEPELGLHPAALTVLADIIKAIAKTTQVICSTQSVTFANFFQPEDFIVVNAQEGVSTFKRLDKVPLESWLEDYAMGDIWAKNLVGGRPAW